jgi:hypothetical protein
MSDDPKHNPGEPEVRRRPRRQAQPGEPEFGSQAEHDHDGEPADADEAARIAEGHS